MAKVAPAANTGLPLDGNHPMPAADPVGPTTSYPGASQDQSDAVTSGADKTIGAAPGTYTLPNGLTVVTH